MVSFSLAAVLVAATSTLVHAEIQYKTMTLMGCFSSSKGLTFNDTWTYQTSGYCQKQCVPINKAVLATTLGTDCWCGDTMPPASAKVADSNCDTNCAGFPDEKCGGNPDTDYWSVWNTGLQQKVYNFGASPSASGSSQTSSSAPSVVTIGGETQTITAPASSKSSSPSKGPNKAAIAASVVVGVVVIAALVGGGYLYMRQRRRRELEDEFKRQAAINSFMAGGKPGSSGGVSQSDSRLDPSIMTQRRMSDGSIADNQDYSRRILKVTNA